MHGDRKFINFTRRDYLKGGLLETELKNNPFDQFSLWFNEAIASKLVDGNAMTLSTSKGKRAVSRIVLLKSFDHNGYIFYTNYGSNKAREIEENNEGSLLFYWAEFERQIRIEGKFSKVSREESADYFKTRPRESQVGAWASKQSSPVESREQLEKIYQDTAKQFEGKDVPLPDFWGGFILKPDYFEFWQGRPNRLHDRLAYQLKGTEWSISRLNP